jgi:hypothetical protein
MAHLLAINPLRAREKMLDLRVITNPFLLKEQQDLVDDLKEGMAWEEEFMTSEQAFYKGIAAIEAARNKGNAI